MKSEQDFLNRQLQNQPPQELAFEIGHGTTQNELEHLHQSETQQPLQNLQREENRSPATNILCLAQQ